MKKKIFLLAIVTLIFGMLVAQYGGEGAFIRVTNLNDLTTGYYVLLGSSAGSANTPQPGAETVNNAMSNNHNGTFLAIAPVTPAGDVITDPPTSIVWFFNRTGDTFTIYQEVNSQYVSYTGSSNNVQLVGSVASDNQRWTITSSPHGSGEHIFYRILNMAETGRALQYNFNQTQERFACYNRTQGDLAFFKLDSEIGDLVATPTFNPGGGNYTTPQNVTISCSTEGATIRYTVDGSIPDENSPIYNTPISVSTTTIIRARGYATGLEPSLVGSAAYTFPTQVANLTALRAQTPGTTTPYMVTGEVVVSMFQAFRGQKYIQDEGAAIMIDDFGGVINTVYSIGDGIINLVGTISLFDGMLQFVPTQDPGPANSTGNAVIPTIVTINQLNTNLESYQSRLVRINNATFAESDFPIFNQGGREWEIYDSTGEYTFRTNFYDADYIGSPVPVGLINIIGVISTRATGSHIAARSLADFTTSELLPAATPVITPPSGVYNSVQSITITCSTPGSSIYYTLNGEAPDQNSTLYNTSFNVLSNTTVRARAYADGYEPSAIATNTYSFPAFVTNLSVLRIQPADGTTVYTVTGQVIMTYKQTFRNQKYFQDGGAGILIDDIPGVITTNYNVGDGIINLTGTLSDFDGMLQFVPTQNPGAPNSTGNTINPILVTFSQLNQNMLSYQSRLVKVNSVNFTTSGNFANGTNYAVNDPTGAYTFRTNFYDEDYIGTAIPSEPAHIVGIVGTRISGSFIAARYLSDFSYGVSEKDIIGEVPITKLNGNYPNPFNPETTISFNLAEKSNVIIEVYNLKGQKIKTLLNDFFDMGSHVITWNGKDNNNQSVGSGIYFYKMTTEEYIATKRMILLK